MHLIETTQVVLTTGLRGAEQVECVLRSVPTRTLLDGSRHRTNTGQAGVDAPDDFLELEDLLVRGPSNEVRDPICDLLHPRRVVVERPLPQHVVGDVGLNLRRTAAKPTSHPGCPVELDDLGVELRHKALGKTFRAHCPCAHVLQLGDHLPRRAAVGREEVVELVLGGLPDSGLAQRIKPGVGLLKRSGLLCRAQNLRGRAGRSSDPGPCSGKGSIEAEAEGGILDAEARLVAQKRKRALRSAEVRGVLGTQDLGHPRHRIRERRAPVRAEQHAVSAVGCSGCSCQLRLVSEDGLACGRTTEGLGSPEEPALRRDVDALGDSVGTAQPAHNGNKSETEGGHRLCALAPSALGLEIEAALEPFRSIGDGAGGVGAERNVYTSRPSL